MTKNLFVVRVDKDTDVLKARIRRSLHRNESLVYTLVTLTQIEPATVSDVWKKTIENFMLDQDRSSTFSNLQQLLSLRLVQRRQVMNVLAAKKNDALNKKIKEKVESSLTSLRGYYKEKFLKAYYYFTTDLVDEFAEWIAKKYPEIGVKK